MSTFDPNEGFVLELPFIPASKKNRTQIKTGRGGRRYVGKSQEVRAQESAIALLAAAELGRIQAAQPLFDDSAALRAELVLCPKLEIVTVRVRQVCWLPTRPKRDAANVPALVLDALQGSVYADDRQVTELEIITDLAS